MVEELDSKNKKSWRKLAIGLCVPLTLAVAIWGDNIPSIPKWNQERKIVKYLKHYGIEFKREDFDVYYKLGCNAPWQVEGLVSSGVNARILEALVNDSEIIGAVREEYKGDDEVKLKKKIVEKIRYLTWEQEFNIDWDNYMGIRTKNNGGFLSMISLKRYRVPVDYGVSGLQQEKKIEDIIEGYSKEAAGVANEVRNAYWDKRGEVDLMDSQIKVFAAKGITPDYFGEIAREGEDAVRTSVKLIQEGKLNGAIFDSWCPPASIKEMLYGIQNRCTPQDVINAHAIRTEDGLGLTLMEYDLQKRLHLDFHKHSPQPVLDGPYK